MVTENKKIAFTCCSNNYLAQAKVLGDSLIGHNPDYQFIICLVDQLDDNLDYSFFAPHIIIPIEKLQIPNFEEVYLKYNIIELNTAVKATCFKYLLKEYKIDFLYYFDPDIMIFNKLDGLEKEFNQNEILLTPHIVSPIEFDELEPRENMFLNYGIYNLGFLGVKNHSSNVNSFLDWWENRTLYNGFIDVKNGFFVDQLWINYVPLFFEKVKITFNLGCNTAPWNIHERKQLSKIGENYTINEKDDLVFYHFSSYSYQFPDRLSKAYTRNTFETCPDYRKIYKIYHEMIVANNVEFISKLKCSFVTKRENIIHSSKVIIYKQSIYKKYARLLVPPILFKLIGKS